ncbi:hypothetical protein F5Y07DRAFT_346322 [Xylaria sp. FL0933]|nr:hypothetical protein F5Y07DRAFT_346322 [Xylaria sp. FL0933]
MFRRGLLHCFLAYCVRTYLCILMAMYATSAGVGRTIASHPTSFSGHRTAPPCSRPSAVQAPPPPFGSLFDSNLVWNSPRIPMCLCLCLFSHGWWSRLCETSSSWAHNTFYHSRRTVIPFLDITSAGAMLMFMQSCVQYVCVRESMFHRLRAQAVEPETSLHLYKSRLGSNERQHRH